MSFPRFTATATVAAALALAACGDDGGPMGICGDGTAPCAEAVAICEEYGDVVATAFSDCGLGTYEENLQGFEDALPAPCSEAADIRQESDLVEVCWPFFTDASCETLMDEDFADMIPDECRGQIIFPE